MEINLKWNSDGLIPAIIQDVNTRQVLMLGYMNEESLKRTLETGNVTFFSRSRNTLWMKGETSGNTLKLISMKADCDDDTLLIDADPAGPTCHTGETSCFFKSITNAENENKRTPQSKRTLEDLMDTIQDRKMNPVEGSYTNYLIDKGLGKILKKVGEESAEIIIASLSEDKASLVGEIGDLLYHLTVLMVERDVSWEEILELLDGRAASK